MYADKWCRVTSTGVPAITAAAIVDEAELAETRSCQQVVTAGGEGGQCGLTEIVRSRKGRYDEVCLGDLLIVLVVPYIVHNLDHVPQLLGEEHFPLPELTEKDEFEGIFALSIIHKDVSSFLLHRLVTPKFGISQELCL